MFKIRRAISNAHAVARATRNMPAFRAGNFYGGENSLSHFDQIVERNTFTGVCLLGNILVSEPWFASVHV